MKYEEHLQHTIDELRTTYSYPRFLICGDFNNFPVASLCQLAGLQQIVTAPTHGASLLDVILTDLGDYYHEPEMLSPLGRSKHVIVYTRPRVVQPAPRQKTTVRMLPDSGVRAFGRWITAHDWSPVYDASSPDEQVAVLQSSLFTALNHYLPTKTLPVRHQEKPYITATIRQVIAQKHEAFRLEGMSARWRHLRNKVTYLCRKAKAEYYDRKIRGVRTAKPATWYRQIKTLTGRVKNEPLNFSEYETRQELAEAVNQHFSSVCSQLPALDLENFPAYLPADAAPPVIKRADVQRELSNIRCNIATTPNELPPRLVKEFAFELSQPLTHIFNSSLSSGIFPSAWKLSYISPIPKVNPPASFNDLRPISLTPLFSKVFEGFLTKYIMTDISESLDPCQFGNRPKYSTVHYLISLYDFLAKNTDHSSTTAAILAIDFSKAFDLVSHDVVLKKLLDLHLRPSVVPTVANFLSGRRQVVQIGGSTTGTKHVSTELNTTCGTPQGTKIAPIAFLAHINDCAVAEQYRWKYVDDLSIGVLSPTKDANALFQKAQIVASSLETWSELNQMKINGKKCQMIICNFSHNTVPDSNVSINNVHVPIVSSMKLLGVYITSDLKWTTHIKHITKAASRKLFMLTILRQFRADLSDLRSIYISFIRPTLEYCSQLWHPGLTHQQEQEIERVQKRAFKIMIGYDDYTDYTSACQTLSLETLKERRDAAFNKLASDILSDSAHPLYPTEQLVNGAGLPLRRQRKFVVPRAATERYRKSPVPALISLMNNM